MWANAERDGRPAEYRWRRLFSAAKFGWHPLVPYINAAKTRNSLKLVGVPHTIGQISAPSGPKFTILWGHVEEILLLNNFFSDCRYVPQLRSSLIKLCDGAQMAIFWRLFASCISASPVQHVEDLHLKFALRPHHVCKCKYGRHQICEGWD